MRLSSSCHPSDKIIRLAVYTATVYVRFEFFHPSVLSPRAVDKMPAYVTPINTRSMKPPTPPRYVLRGVLVVICFCLPFATRFHRCGQRVEPVGI